jgi:hypothetical protein
LIDSLAGLEKHGTGIWRVYFQQKLLGYADEKNSAFALKQAD